MNAQRRRQQLWLLLLLAFFTTGAFLIGRLSSEQPAPDHAPGPAASTPGEPSAEGRQILYWRAPMDPNETYDRPGKSRMGMDLVPVYADEGGASSEGVVAIDPVTLQNIGVRTTPVTVEALERAMRTTGRFEMNEQGAYTVSLKVGGWVEQLFVDYEGAIVRKGQPLLALYSPELVSTQEEYLLALRNARRLTEGPAAEDARRLLEAARRRLAYWDLTEAQIQHLEASGTPQRTLTFYAPASGEMMNKHVVEGQQVAAGQALMDLVDISKIWLIADVYEQDLGWVKTGTAARIELPYQPGQTWQGRVEHIYYMLDPESRTARARIVLPGGKQTPFKPGMYATVYLEGTQTAPAAVVPEEAVLRTGEEDVVIVSLGGGRFQPRTVRTGIQADGKVQILEGLQEGDLVVTSAQFLIDSEARLKGALGAMTGGHDHGAQAAQSMPGMPMTPEKPAQVPQKDDLHNH